MLHVANQGPLPAEWFNHTLTKAEFGCQGCQIGEDFLLIYAVDNTSKNPSIVFTRTGTHSELFE